MKSLRRLLTAILVGILAGFSPPGYADDTELYLKQVVDISEDSLPNVLFVLDRSGSMGERDGGDLTRLERMQQALIQLLDEIHNVNVGFMTFSGQPPESWRPDDAVVPVRFPITYIDEPLVNVAGEQGSSSSAQTQFHILSSADDAEQGVSSGTMILGETVLEATYRAGGTETVESRITENAGDAREFLTNEGSEPQGKVYATSNDWMALGGSSRGEVIVGLRFPAVAVPPGATIQDAEIVFKSQEDESNSLDLVIHGVKADNPGNFQELDYYVSSNYPTTDASVTWANVESWANGQNYATPNLKDIVQEIVNRAGWASGNAMAFRLTRTPPSYLPDNRRPFKTAGEGEGPLLRISYQISSDDQLIGLRFQNVQIPQGATITQARLDFTSGPDESSSASFRIRGEDQDNSPAFTTAQNDLANRSLTSALVHWNNADVGAWTSNGVYSTPDLTSIVQEIVNRTGWCGSNALSFIIYENSTNSLRKIKSYDDSPDKAPVLHVEYDQASVPPNACNHPIYSTQITNNKDDVEEFVDYPSGTDGAISLSSGTLEMTTNNAALRIIGFRFPQIPIKQGTTILKAELVFTAKNSDSSLVDSRGEPLALEISAELSPNAEAFETDRYHLSNRSKTSGVAWTPATAEAPLTPWIAGQQYTTPDLRTIVQQIVNQSNWHAFNDMAFFVSGSGLRRAASYDHDPSQAAILRIQVEESLSELKVRDRLKELVDEITTNRYTPLVDAIYEAGQYYMGGAVTHGADRKQLKNDSNDNDINKMKRNRLSHIASWEWDQVPDGTIDPPNCANVSTNACATEKLVGNAKYIKPQNSLCQPNFIVFLTDGLATTNGSKDLVKALPDIELDAGNCQSGYSNKEKCGVDMVRYLYNIDLDQEKVGVQNVITHTIGFNLDAPGGADYMRDWAEAGGGGFYEANSAEELLDVFQQIMATIITDSTSFAAPSLSINAFSRLDHDNQVYFALFRPEHLASWAGNVKKYNICDNDENCGAIGIILDANANPAMTPENQIRNGCGDEACDDPYVAVDLWNPNPSHPDGSNVRKGGTGSVLLQRVQPPYDPDDRKIYTDIGGILTEVITVNSSTLRPHLDVSTDAEAETLINWIRGYQDGDPNLGVRDWLLDDSLHSSPGAITIGKDESDNAITNIYIATNEGAIRMLNGETGVEEWMFIPKGMLSIQQRLMENPSTTNHTYGIDGNIAFIVHDENKDEVINPTDGDTVKLFVGMRRGGRNIYALDVTPDPAGDHQPSLLWTIKGGTGDFVRLGQTWSMPKPTKVRFGGVSKTVLLFGGGYEPETQDDPETYSSVSAYSNAIYMVDPDDGTRLWWASNTGSGADLELTGMDYSIPSDLDLMDGTGDGFTDRLYVGDTGGQVWRIDLDPDGGHGIGGRLASLGKTDADVSNKRRFFYPPEVVKLRDSTYTPESYSKYDLVLIGSGHRPNPLGTDIQDRLYALRDRAIEGLIDVDGDGEAEMDEPTDLPSYQFFTLTHDYLFDATANLIQDGDDTQKVAALESLQETYGWYIDLERLGEKNLSAPLVVLGVAYFTTFVPPSIDASTDCVTAEGSGWIYALDILTGAAVNPDYDETNGDQIKKSDRSKKIGEGIPSKVVPIIIGDKIVLLTGSGGGIYSETVPLDNDQDGNVPANEPRILYWIKE
jgi:type IV pilus assembly protein PilY1